MRMPLARAPQAFAENTAAGADGTISIPGNLSGFHRASANLYVTLYGLASTNNPDKTITVKRQKSKSGKDRAAEKREAEAAAEATEEDELDFKTRLKLRLEKKEARCDLP